MERLDYLDENGNKIGTVEREVGINTNLLLEAVQIWIINPDTKEVLMQRRSYSKKHDPGMIDISASGIIQSGETPMQGLIREGKEELGEKAFEKLIGKINEIYKFQIDFTKEGRKGKYLTHEYLAYSKQPLGEYEKQDEEVEELFFMDYEEVKKLIKNKDKNIRIPYNDDIEELLQRIDNHLLHYKQTIEEDER